MKPVAVIISPNYRDYGRKYLADCLASIRAQDYGGQIKIFITDNETSAASVRFLQSLAPEAQLILNKANDGFAKGVNDALRLALSQGFAYLAVVNIHTILAPDYISQLVKVLASNQNIGVAQGLMLLWPDKSRINSRGNITHFLGFGYCLGYREKVSGFNFKTQNNFIHYPSGSSMFFARSALEKVGLLDEEYWMYNEDQEIGWRLWLAGYQCVLAPQAIIYNKYKFQRSIKKFYWMDRNRIISILLCYRLLTLILILPALAVMEVGLALFALKGGWFKEKAKVWAYFLRPRTWRYLARARRRNQSLRQVPDKKIIPLLTGRIWYQEIGDWKLRLANPFFSLYWQIIKRLIFW